MKGQKSILVFILAILSLITIGGVFASGILKRKPKPDIKKEEPPSVLGEIVEPSITPTPALKVDQIVKTTFDEAKEGALQKAGEVQKVVVNTLTKEVSQLTQSQIESLKLQICRDWGVVKTSPSPSP